MRKKINSQAINGLIFILLLLVVFYGILYALRLLPLEHSGIAIDWKEFYPVISGGQIRYITTVRNPPWILMLLLPFGLFRFDVSWALISTFTLMILVWSVPPTSSVIKKAGAALIVIGSYPSVRHLVDGNLEALVIAGALLIILGYKNKKLVFYFAGLFLLTSKPQETWLLFPAAIVWANRYWNDCQEKFRWGGVLSIYIGLSLLFYGEGWLNALRHVEDRAPIMNSSLINVLGRSGIPSTWGILVWGIIFMLTLGVLFKLIRRHPSRITVGFLLSASFLLSPYVAGNSMLTLLAVSGVPLLFQKPVYGIILFSAVNLQYLFPQAINYQYGPAYATGMFLMTWIFTGLFAVSDDGERSYLSV